MRFSGQAFIITGASRGIGASTAQLMAQGAKLVLGARSHADLTAVADRVQALGGTAVCVAGDVRDETYCQALSAIAVERFGRLDGAFNNAATLGRLGPVQTLSREDWIEVLDVNLTSAFQLAKHQFSPLQASGGGSIVFTGSFVGHTIGLPGMGAYAASKAGLVGLTQCLAADWGEAGIRVNTLMPGGTLTDMAPQTLEAQKAVAGMHALRRMASADEIAAVARFLLSAEASFITGSALLADGGNSIFKPGP